MGALDGIKKVGDAVQSSGAVGDIGKIAGGIKKKAAVNLGKEMDRIRDRLDKDEEVILFARQSRGVMPGKGMITPRAIFLTPKRVVLRAPTRLGKGETIEDYYYSEITNVRLEKGMRSSAIVLSIPGMTERSKSGFLGRSSGGGHGEIGGLDTEEAEEVYEYIRAKTDEAKKQKMQPQVVQQQAAAQNPMDMLKTRLITGEIDEAEYKRLKELIGD